MGISTKNVATYLVIGILIGLGIGYLVTTQTSANQIADLQR